MAREQSYMQFAYASRGESSPTERLTACGELSHGLLSTNNCVRLDFILGRWETVILLQSSYKLGR